VLFLKRFINKVGLDLELLEMAFFPHVRPTPVIFVKSLSDCSCMHFFISTCRFRDDIFGFMETFLHQKRGLWVINWGSFELYDT